MLGALALPGPVTARLPVNALPCPVRVSVGTLGASRTFTVGAGVSGPIRVTRGGALLAVLGPGESVTFKAWDKTQTARHSEEQRAENNEIRCFNWFVV